MTLRLRWGYLATSLLVFVVALLVMGCGSNYHRPKPAPKPVAGPSTVVRPAACPSDGFMGCAAGDAHLPSNAPPKEGVTQTTPPTGCIIPDVSNWQGHPNWAEAKDHICGGIFKAGEGTSEDVDAAFNHSELSSLGIWHTSYWFVQPGVSCTAQADAYVRVLKSLFYTADRLAGPPVLDEEEGGIAGYATCMASIIYGAFHVWPVIYTAPGTWPGGSSDDLLAWPADYGPNVAPCLPFRCTQYVAFQFAAPPYRYYYVPGLGYQDESVDYTFTQLTPFAVPTPTPHQISWWMKARDASYVQFAKRSCDAHLARADCWTFGYHRVLFFSAKLALSRGRIHCYGRRAQPKRYECLVVKPYVARWETLRDQAAADHQVGREAHYAELVKAYLY